MKSLRRVFSQVSKPDLSLAPPMDCEVPFEGVEKRLLCFFDVKKAANHDIILPAEMSEAEWQVILDHAHCEIVSKKSLADATVYLLSESTLTVWPNGFLMKTCGRTTPFLAFKALCDAFGREAFLDSLQWLCYSRLDFLHPEFQVWPHQNAEQEVAFMRQYLPEVHSFSLPAAAHTMCGLFFGSSDAVAAPFRTEEVLMMKVHPNCVRYFTGFDTPSEREGRDDGSDRYGVVRSAVGERSELDEFWFSPWGYSCNALKANDSCDLDYFSCHVSPEPATSYASLEIAKRGTNSAVPPKAPGLAFTHLIPPFQAKTLHLTSIEVLDSQTQTAEMEDIFEDSISSVKLEEKYSNYCLTHSEVCRFAVGNTRAVVYHQVYVKSDADKWTGSSQSTQGSDSD